MEIRSFKSEYKELKELIHKSWIHEHDGFIDFDEKYLEFLIESPDKDEDLTLGAYKDGKLISFVIGKNINLSINGKTYKAFLNTMAATDPEFAHLYPYINIKDFCLRKGVEKGYEANFGFCAEGITNNQIEQICIARRGYKCFCVNSFGSFIGTAEKIAAADNPLPAELEIEFFHEKDTEKCLKILENTVKNCVIYQKWKKESFLHRMLNKDFCLSSVIKKNGKINGFVNFLLINMNNKGGKTKTCIVYNLFLDAFPQSEKNCIIRQIAKDMQSHGAEVISIPDTGYFNPEDLKKIGFRKYPFKKYKTNLYLTIFNSKGSFGSEEHFYLEII